MGGGETHPIRLKVYVCHATSVVGNHDRIVAKVNSACRGVGVVRVLHELTQCNSRPSNQSLAKLLQDRGVNDEALFWHDVGGLRSRCLTQTAPRRCVAMVSRSWARRETPSLRNGDEASEGGNRPLPPAAGAI